MIAFVSKGEADYRTLRETAGRLSQSVVACADVREALRAIRWHAPEIVVCEARKTGNWQELLEEAQAAQSLLLIVSRHADERLWAEVLTRLNGPLECCRSTRATGNSTPLQRWRRPRVGPQSPTRRPYPDPLDKLIWPYGPQIPLIDRWKRRARRGASRGAFHAA
jgi:hypothetical protein